MTTRATTAAAAGFRRRAGLEVLTWPVFDPLAVDVMVTTRHGGVSGGGQGPYATLNLSLQTGDELADVLENRRRVAAAIGAGPADFVYARQVHGATARVVSAADRGRGTVTAGDAIPDADALVTADPGVVLAVLVADCVPVVLYDPAARVLACVHAGWRGTVARVASSALTVMRTLGARPADVIAGIGPAIDPERYQVGEDVAAAAEQAFGPMTGEVLRPDGTGKWLFDAWAGNHLTLREAGVPARNIHLAGVPTGPEPGQFFSHRAQQPCGRFALVARLRRDGGVGPL
ncbi:MAG: peptidoglycan editing factor PgeF [Actinobacteria bacterium]|nr:peptidoglycan editing factor PgeF [Actinomycetota bacterium]